jgi:hypothetical protein
VTSTIVPEPATILLLGLGTEAEVLKGLARSESIDHRRQGPAMVLPFLLIANRNI